MRDICLGFEARLLTSDRVTDDNIKSMRPGRKVSAKLQFIVQRP